MKAQMWKVFGSKPKQGMEFLKKALDEKVTVQVEQGDWATQMKMIDLTREEIQIAKAVQPLVIEHIEQIVSIFYNSILGIKHLQAIIQQHTTVDRLRKTLQTHLVEMFSGQIDAEYFRKRIRVAEVHVHIGLEPKWYMGAFQNLQNMLLEMIYQNIQDRDECLRVSKVVSKILNFEQQLVLEAYEKENIRQRDLQYTQVKEELKAKISDITENLTALAQQTSTSVDVLVTSSQEVSRSVHVTTERSKETQSHAQTGQQWVRELESRIQSIQQSTSTMEQTIVQLNESSKRIGEVVALVQEIADQTNMLAINSSIEAARAGEHGRGFAVVANEVHNLSQQTKTSVLQISGLIAKSTELTSEVVRSIGEVRELVEKGQQGSNATSVAFTDILNSMDGSIGEIRRVESEIGELVRIIEEIGTATQRVAVSAEQLNNATLNI